MLRKISSMYREGGLIGIWLAAINKLPGVGYCLDFSLYRLRFEDFEARGGRGEELRVELFDTTAPLDHLRRVQAKVDQYRRRLENGDWVAIAYIGSTPVGHVWLQFQRHHVEERFRFRLALDPRDVLDFDAHVAPAHRGKGTLRQIHAALIERLRGHPEKSQFAALIEQQNKRSIRAYRYMGFKPVERYLAFRIFGMERLLRLR